MSTKQVFRAILDFFNIIEPGSPIRLSPTQIGLWAAIGISIFVAVTSPANIGAVLTALGAALPFVINYMHQRSTRARNPDQAPPPSTN